MFHNCEGQSHKTVSTDHNNLWRERRAEADSNWGPSAYQPNALPLGQTHSHCHCCWWLLLHSTILHSWAESLRSHVIQHEWLVFTACFWIYTKVVCVLTALTRLVPLASSSLLPCMGSDSYSPQQICSPISLCLPSKRPESSHLLPLILSLFPVLNDVALHGGAVVLFRRVELDLHVVLVIVQDVRVSWRGGRICGAKKAQQPG